MSFGCQRSCCSFVPLTSLCHSNGHIETMPAREMNPFTALTRIRSQFLRTQWWTIISEWTRLCLRPLNHRGWLSCCSDRRVSKVLLIGIWVFVPKAWFNQATQCHVLCCLKSDTRLSKNRNKIHDLIWFYWMFYDHFSARSLLAKLGRWGWWWAWWGWLERKARRH